MITSKRESPKAILRLTGIAILLLGSSPAVFGQEFKLEEGFVSMFNGKDFSGWQFGKGYGLPTETPKNNWTVANGVMKVAANGRGNVGSQWSYVDFDMRFQWRALRAKYNSGFFIRSGRRVRANQINLAKGGEGRFFGGKMNGGKAVPELQKPAEEWNDWRVLVVGDTVTFWCNGKRAWKGTEFAAKSGHIGLQAEGAPLEFRRLRIKEIGYDYLDHLKQWEGTGWKMEGDALAGSQPLKSKKSDYKDLHLRLEWTYDKSPAGKIALGKADVPLAVVAKAVNPPGVWNYFELTRKGNKATVWLNGETMEKELAGSGGAIGLLPSGGTLKVRNIRVKK